MRPYALAFEEALTLLSSPVPGDLDMYDTLIKAIAAARVLNPRDKLGRWWDKVTIVLRNHPDMEDFRVAFDLSPEKQDAIFRVAIAIDEGNATDSQVVIDLIADAEATS
ncbi:hypothetical protein [uncultured Roseobacter sp.]|uniref:hypothetical protein n=1 Tax=uncultured Roseobacter sp. TaxID=114847 RepID=UPI002612EC9F|nr:hypothetical protein [uncultured Roseobacter sp.]